MWESNVASQGSEIEAIEEDKERLLAELAEPRNPTLRVRPAECCRGSSRTAWMAHDRLQTPSQVHRSIRGSPVILLRDRLLAALRHDLLGPEDRG